MDVEQGPEYKTSRWDTKTNDADPDGKSDDNVCDVKSHIPSGRSILYPRDWGTDWFEAHHHSGRSRDGEWDKQFNRLMEIRGLNFPVCKRYVDNVDIVYGIETGGTTGELVEDVAHIMVEANSIIDCIQMEEDIKDNYPDGKIPILDLKVWVQNDEIV